MAFSSSFIFFVSDEEQNFGILAQLGEHLPYKQGVTGSSPVGPTRTYKCTVLKLHMSQRDNKVLECHTIKRNMPMWLNWQSS